MKLFDFFFPEQAQAAHLRRLSEMQSFARRRSAYNESMCARRHDGSERRLAALEEEVGFLSLMLEAIIRKSEAKGVVTRDELKALMTTIDLEDGRADGQYRPQ